MNEKSARILIGIGITVIVLIALFCFFTLFVAPAHAPGTKSEEASARKSYTNSAHNYAFTYPSIYTVQEYSPDYVNVGTALGTDGFDSVAEADVFVQEASNSSESLEEFAHERAMSTCAADGPTASIDCPNVSRSSVFTTDSGVGGEEFYLTQDTHSLASGTVAETERGPYFAFPLPGADTLTVLLIRPPSATEPDMIDEDTVTGVAKSLRIPATP